MSSPREKDWLQALLLTSLLCLSSGASLETASLQLGTLQSQSQYAPAALQGAARTASRSAASCLVTAVQYTHGQQIWRADPCEFCLCLDGEMFCWWQECPPESSRPCLNPQPYGPPCENSTSNIFDTRPKPVVRKSKKVYSKKTTPAKPTKAPLSKPLITTSLSSSSLQENGNNNNNNNSNMSEKSTYSYFSFSSTPDKGLVVEEEQQLSAQSSDDPEINDSGLYKTKKEDIDKEVQDVCLVMGISYKIGQSLPSTGSCLACRCEGGGVPGTARVVCAPRGCAPPDTPASAALTDDPETF